VDLGGIGKEYAVDRCTTLARSAANVPAMINFGGDLAVTSAPVIREAWKIGIEGPTVDAAEKLVVLRQGALATSGDARRFLIRDGVRYSHILDPGTGWPVPDAPASITVAADTCTQAGMLSTLAMLRGADAEAFLAAQELLHWCRR
jgi:thiamine biosynthesis lipoprotein